MNHSLSQIKKIIEKGCEIPLATKHYPSRGQSAVQKLFQTSTGKLFLKKVSERNHRECQIDVKSGTLAEREFWATQLGHSLGIEMPNLWLLDDKTTVQEWLSIPDARVYCTDRGPMALKQENVFDCSLFDWLTGQIDRHDANYLYNYVDEQIILIDSAHSFLKYTGSIPDYLKFFEATQSSKLETALDTKTHFLLFKLTSAKLKSLVPLRNADEMDSLIHRHSQLLHMRSIGDLVRLYRSHP